MRMHRENAPLCRHCRARLRAVALDRNGRQSMQSRRLRFAFAGFFRLVSMDHRVKPGGGDKEGEAL
jgi:hypothetical protein